jgi:hypothetical protein
MSNIQGVDSLYQSKSLFPSYEVPKAIVYVNRYIYTPLYDVSKLSNECIHAKINHTKQTVRRPSRGIPFTKY